MHQTSVKKILFLSANPSDTSTLRLGEEVREIEEGLRRSRYRDQFEMISKWAVRTQDLYRYLLDVQPQIIHFSGHGIEEEGIVLEDDTGVSKLVATDALENLFKIFSNKGIECVLLNSCFSEVQAEAIGKYIPYVIGMSKGIEDQSAIVFSTGFYDALAAGETIQFAYQLGCSAIQISGLRESKIPVIKTGKTLNFNKKTPDVVKSALKRREITYLKELVQVHSDSIEPSHQAEISILLTDRSGWETACSSASNDTELLFWKARGNLLMGDYEDSATTLLDLLQLNNNSHEFRFKCLRNLGNAFIDCDVYDVAFNLLEIAQNMLDLFQSNKAEIEVLTDFARCMYRQGDMNKAFRYAQRAIKICNKENNIYREQIISTEIIKGYLIQSIMNKSQNAQVENSLMEFENMQSRMESINRDLNNSVGITSWNVVKALRLFIKGERDSCYEELARIFRATQNNPFNFYGSYESAKLILALLADASYSNIEINRAYEYVMKMNREKQLVSALVTDARLKVVLKGLS